LEPLKCPNLLFALLLLQMICTLLLALFTPSVFSDYAVMKTFANQDCTGSIILLMATEMSSCLPLNCTTGMETTCAQTSPSSPFKKSVNYMKYSKDDCTGNITSVTFYNADTCVSSSPALSMKFTCSGSSLGASSYASKNCTGASTSLDSTYSTTCMAGMKTVCSSATKNLAKTIWFLVLVFAITLVL